MTDSSGAPSPAPSEAAPGGLSNLQQRLRTALILLPVTVVLTIVGGLPFTLMIAFIAIMVLLELFALQRAWRYQGQVVIGVVIAVAVIIAVHADEAVLWQAALAVGLLIALLYELSRRPEAATQATARALITFGGVLYIAVPAACVILIRALPHGLTWLLMALVMTWATDTCAYFGGRQFGRHKLAPRISPKKTVEGAVAGFIGGTLAGLIILVAGDLFTTETLPLLILAPVIGTLGDLFESAIKRHFNVKDSHLPHFDVLPGHGGVLDRIDSLLFVMAFVYVYIRLFNLPL